MQNGRTAVELIVAQALMIASFMASAAGTLDVATALVLSTATAAVASAVYLVRHRERLAREDQLSRKIDALRRLSVN